MLPGDLGSALTSSRPIAKMIGARIFNTVLLSLYAFIIYIPLALIPALVQAANRDRKVDHAVSVVNLLFLSIPTIFWGPCCL